MVPLSDFEIRFKSLVLALESLPPLQENLGRERDGRRSAGAFLAAAEVEVEVEEDGRREGIASAIFCLGARTVPPLLPAIEARGTDSSAPGQQLRLLLLKTEDIALTRATGETERN